MTIVAPNLPTAPILYFEPEDLIAPPAWVANFDKVVQIPSQLAEKQTLLASYASRLELPAQFTRDWNDFSRCLFDLSWLRERNILLLHEDLPLADKEGDLSEYLSLLVNAQERWAHSPDRKLTLAFPSALRSRVRELLPKR